MNPKLPSISLIYSNRRENSNKYYILTIVEDGSAYKVICKYGRLGKSPREQEKPYSTIEQATNFYKDKLSELRGKGYEEVDISEIIMSDGSFVD
ncbi:TPA: WGR domain-containing protein [Clostridium botulinum]|nr:WGR domain-containing protein [Clostridium botulinum]